jgi:hypothetical protein
MIMEAGKARANERVHQRRGFLLRETSRRNENKSQTT